MIKTWDPFKFFLSDNGSGLCYSVDSNGLIVKGNPLLSDRSLKHAPATWEDMQLTFERSARYRALNRSYSNSFKFVRDGAQILRTLLYTGKGIEAGVTLIVCKWDPLTGHYRLYYSGQIDFGKGDDLVTEGITVDTLEGGAAQLLKTYENTIHEIPCDGSIPINIKVNADGKLYNDVFHYQILQVTNTGGSVCTVPCAFVSNDGDNVGISKNASVLFEDLALPITPLNYEKVSSNFLLSSLTPITVRLQGSIVVKPEHDGNTITFSMFTRTNLSAGLGGGDFSHSYNLVPGSGPTFNFLDLTGQKVFYFDRTIPLEANENLFMMFASGDAGTHCQILGGSFSMTFSSRYPASTVWGITMYDLFKEIVRRNNLLASTTNQPFDFEAQSNLLQEKINVIVTSGDAARASTDPNYFQFYNQATINPANPGNQFYNPFPFQGPSIKACLADLFDTANPLFCVALGPQKLPGQKESLFLERLSYVFNPNVITMTLNRVANLRVTVDTDSFFNWLRMGYQPQQYDEKSGKYETNSLNQWQAPIKSVIKALELISKWRADSDGFEFTRYNTQGGKSSTYNGNDNSVFLLDTDPTTFIYDFYEAYFKSLLPDPSQSANTNQRFVANQAYQPVLMTTMKGQYFVNGLDFSIFMFNQAAPGSQTINVNFTALLNGLPGDSATIRMYINGSVVRTWSQAINSVNTPFAVNDNNVRVFNKGDNIYFTIDTVRTCAVSLTSFTLTIGSAYFIASSVGNVDIPAGSTSQMIGLPLITAQFVVPAGTAHIPVVSSGFQYFRFLSPVHTTGFNYTAGFSFYIYGRSGLPVSFDMWKNGVNVGTVSANSTGNIYAPHNQPDAQGNVPVMFSGHFDFNNYDVIWFTTSTDDVSSWVNAGDFKLTSDSIRAISLARPAFDSVRGIPNPQTAFNIRLSPGRMVQENKSLLAVGLYNQAPGQLKFQTADKNQFLSTTMGAVTVTENANIDVHDLGMPAWYPFLLHLDTEVGEYFNDLLTGQANGHIEVLWGGKNIYGYPMKVTSKPAYNESQSWVLRISTRTNLADLVGLDLDGIIPLQLMDSFIPDHCPVHCVPLNLQLDPRINDATMDEDWFKNRYADWLASEDFFNPWQQNDTISWQFQSNGLDPVNIQVLDGDGNYLGNPINVPSVATTALPIGQTLYQLDMLLATFAEGTYYFLISFGVGEGMGVWVSEPIQVKAKWAKTILVRYSHSRNIMGTVFSNGYNPSFRTHGMVGRFKPKSKFTLFNDQQQDADITGAVSYRTWKLQIGHKDGLIPDYVCDLMERIMDLDTVYINSTQYTRDGNDGWQDQTFNGDPKIISTIDIRKARNTNGSVLNTAHQLTSDMSGGYTIDPGALGQSLVGQDLVQVNTTP